MNLKYTANTLKKMEQLFEEVRYRIRYEKGNFNSGYCILEDKKVAVVNKFLDIEGRINALLDILGTIEVDREILSSDMLRWYQQLNEGAGPSTVQSKLDFES